jgi:hypothetical protein
MRYSFGMRCTWVIVAVPLWIACGHGDDTSVPADAGLPATATTCDHTGAEVLGELATDRGLVTFGAGTAMYAPGNIDQPPVLSITAASNTLSFWMPGAQAMPPAVGEYPFMASANGLSAQIRRFVVDVSDWPADVSQRCFAGRFEAMFEGRGTLVGWFRVP